VKQTLQKIDAFPFVFNSSCLVGCVYYTNERNRERKRGFERNHRRRVRDFNRNSRMLSGSNKGLENNHQ